MIQAELKEVSGAAKAKNWVEFLSESTDVLYLVANLTQEASLETVLSAAFSLKHAANMKKTDISGQHAQQPASQLLPKWEVHSLCEWEAYQTIRLQATKC